MLSLTERFVTAGDVVLCSKYSRADVGRYQIFEYVLQTPVQTTASELRAALVGLETTEGQVVDVSLRAVTGQYAGWPVGLMVLR